MTTKGYAPERVNSSKPSMWYLLENKIVRKQLSTNLRSALTLSFSNVSLSN